MRDKPTFSYRDIITPKLAQKMQISTAVATTAAGAVGYMAGYPVTGALYGAAVASAYHAGVVIGAERSANQHNDQTNAVIEEFTAFNNKGSLEVPALALMAIAYAVPEYRTLLILASTALMTCSGLARGVVYGYNDTPVRTEATTILLAEAVTAPEGRAAAPSARLPDTSSVSNVTSSQLQRPAAAPVHNR